MKMIAKKMIQVNGKLYAAGESFEVCDSQALLMIKNGFADEDHSRPVKKVEPVKEVAKEEPVEVAKEQPKPKKSKKAKK